MLTPAASDIEILLAELRERGCEFRDKRQVPLDVVEKLKQLGVYRALVPQQWGGDEITPTAFIEMVERIAEADGSTGWTASLGIAPVYLGALPRATLEQVYATSPDLTFAGRFASHSATRVPGGIRVSGRWPFGSGCLTASRLGVGISIPGEEVRDAVWRSYQEKRRESKRTGTLSASPERAAMT
jgi:indole-3-acetate monooxygenase